MLGFGIVCCNCKKRLGVERRPSGGLKLCETCIKSEQHSYSHQEGFCCEVSLNQKVYDNEIKKRETEDDQTTD